MKFPITIAQAAGLFGILVIIALSLVPGSDRPQTGLPALVEHFIAYCATASALALGFRSRASRVAIVLGFTLLAGLMEVMQLWVPGRSSAMIDAVVSSAGGLLGIVLGGILLDLAVRAYKSTVASAIR